MAIYLGNLTVKDMEKRMNITLTDDERKTLEAMRTDNAGVNHEDAFHIFDIPQCFVCGSMATAMKIQDILKPYTGKIEGIWVVYLSDKVSK